MQIDQRKNTKETVALASPVWKIFYLTTTILIIVGTIAVYPDLEWYYWILIPLAVLICLLAFYLTLIERLVFDYENKKIIYYAFRKRVIVFDEICGCQEEKELHTDLEFSETTYLYIYIKKTDGSIVKVSVDCIPKDKRKIVIEKINGFVKECKGENRYEFDKKFQQNQ